MRTDALMLLLLPLLPLLPLLLSFAPCCPCYPCCLCCPCCPLLPRLSLMPHSKVEIFRTWQFFRTRTFFERGHFPKVHGSFSKVKNFSEPGTWISFRTWFSVVVLPVAKTTRTTTKLSSSSSAFVVNLCCHGCCCRCRCYIKFCRHHFSIPEPATLWN